MVFSIFPSLSLIPRQPDYQEMMRNWDKLQIYPINVSWTYDTFTNTLPEKPPKRSLNSILKNISSLRSYSPEEPFSPYASLNFSYSNKLFSEKGSYLELPQSCQTLRDMRDFAPVQCLHYMYLFSTALPKSRLEDNVS